MTPLLKLPNNVGNLGKIIVANCFEWLPKVQKIAQSGHTASEQQNYLANESWTRLQMLGGEVDIWAIRGLFFSLFLSSQYS